ncbi:unnamed protein product [Rotaria sp. Silwood1]|nr:unnamed protein product [Rotaria sp. Silwood1]CAF1579634.1 unnamed protein product [Rotaria sp. Silwood1]CAF1587302.1 unnamed protein product [Rotaria sp. Silwood1]
MVDNFDSTRNAYIVDNNDMDYHLNHSLGFDIQYNNIDQHIVNNNLNLDQDKNNNIGQTGSNHNSEEDEEDQEFNEWFQETILQNAYHVFAYYDYVGINTDDLFTPWDDEMNLDMDQVFTPWDVNHSK